MPDTMLHLGMDVHKGSLTLVVLPADASAPTHVDRLPTNLRKLRRYLARHAPVPAATRVCYEASGAGDVLQHALTEWGCPAT